jgi:hypothetical protein
VRPSRSTVLLTSVLTCLAAAALGIPSASAAGAVFGSGTPGFVVSAADVKVPLTPLLEGDPAFAGEPSVGVDWRTGAALFMAGTNTLKVTLDPTTSKVTWADASAVFGSSQNLDPILSTDPRTGTTLAGGDTGACSAMFRSTDDGASWLPTAPCTGTYDHPTVGWAPSALTPGTDVWYYCQQGPDEHNCAASSDDGLTWLPGTTTGLLTCIGLHGHIKGSQDGYAYLPGKSCFDASSNLVVGGEYTHDDGLTWTEYTIPGASSTAFDPAVTVAPDGTLYEAWQDSATSHPMIASSKDHGATWSPTVDLFAATGSPLVASTFPTLVAGDTGRLAYSFLGTAVGSGDPNTTGFHGVWYLFTSYSYDGGATWTTVQDTATPVQYGEIDAGGTTTSGQRNLLDFIDSAVTQDGRVVVAFADGCLSDCETAGSQAAAESLSTNAWATVAWQNAGRGLYSAYDVATAPAAPTLTASSSGGGVSLAWTAPTDDGGSPVTGYRVYRASGGATPVLLASPTGTAYTDSAATPGTTYTYAVAAVNRIGEGTRSNPVTGLVSAPPAAPVLSVTTTKGLAKLSWTVPDAGSAPITGYGIYRGTAPGAETLIQTITSGTSYVDTVTKGTYYYRVAANSSAGTGALSNEAVAVLKH